MLSPAPALEARVCYALLSDGNNSTVTVEPPVRGRIGPHTVVMQRSVPCVPIAKSQSSTSALLNVFLHGIHRAGR